MPSIRSGRSIVRASACTTSTSAAVRTSSKSRQPLQGVGRVPAQELSARSTGRHSRRCLWHAYGPRTGRAACRGRGARPAAPTGRRAKRPPRASRADPAPGWCAEPAARKRRRRVPAREPLRRRLVGAAARRAPARGRRERRRSCRATFTRIRRQLNAETSGRSRGSRARSPRQAWFPTPRTGRRLRRRSRGCGEAASRRAAARTFRGRGAGDGRASSARAAAGRVRTTRARGRSRRRAPPVYGRTRPMTLPVTADGGPSRSERGRQDSNLRPRA